MLPFANPRHAHEIKRVPRRARWRPTRSLIAGVIDTTTNYVEHPEVDRRPAGARRARASAIRGACMAGTDCGFDTSAGMGRLTADVVWAKLKALREGADLAAARLL